MSLSPEAAVLPSISKSPPLLIGLTIVAFGTSAPEAAVSISATLSGNNGIAVGNVLGSNIFNISFIVGFAALLSPLKVSVSTIKREIPLTIVSALLMLVFVLDPVFGNTDSMVITRSEGIVLLIFFVLFILYILESISTHHESIKDEELPITTTTQLIPNLLKTIGGLTAIIIGGKMVVNASVEIAASLGVSETIIGLTIVAIGTSLPELVTSGIAAYKKEADIAIGNIVGSNIFNVFFILGISSVIHPIVINQSLTFDLIVSLALTFLIYVFSRSERTIIKFEGVILLASYVAYMIYLVL